MLINCCQVNSGSAQKIDPKFTTYPTDCNIRAIEVLDSYNVWYAGSKGRFGYTVDGGINWQVDSIVHPDSDLEFRSIAVTSEAVMLLSVASPAYLFRSSDQGSTWEIVYQEDHPDAFYDSMKFWDDQTGIAMGDPTDDCLSVIITTDGGRNWSKLDCSELPESIEGEAAFAASNSNLSLYEQHAWMVSGGSKARIFHTPDRGKSWVVHQTPILEGKTMTGIFSVDFYDHSSGVVFGGDWENKAVNRSNKAITKDGGHTWQLINDGQDPGYRSCVQFVPGSDAKEMFAVGPLGLSYTRDGGDSWQHIELLDFYTIRLAKEQRIAWLAGKEQIAKMEW